jgi:hypothetical protein
MSSLRRMGVLVPGTEVQMTMDGSGVYRNRRITNAVRRRWYGVGRPEEGKSSENS